jgi:hypothetical protein
VKLWDGEESTKCDGNIYGYSTLMHIIKSGGKLLNEDN